jgi:hypothetical protein
MNSPALVSALTSLCNHRRNVIEALEARNEALLRALTVALACRPDVGVLPVESFT